VPTLIIVGEGEIPDVHAHAGAIEAGIANARREIISHAGHLPAFERPQETNNLIRSFILKLAFLNMISREGIPAAVKDYQASLACYPGAKPLPEANLNQMGYQSMQSGRTGDALTLFKLAVDVYPNSFNVYDSYGEALLQSGDTARAVANYKRSLELNPKNTNAVQVLQRLQMR
jgi:tetratricopeptide (TPR) repeat protein